MSAVQVSMDAASQATPYVRVALENLLRAWDAINQAERIVGFDITMDDLSNLAAGLSRPETVRDRITAQVVGEWLSVVASTTNSRP